MSIANCKSFVIFGKLQSILSRITKSDKTFCPICAPRFPRSCRIWVLSERQRSIRSASGFPFTWFPCFFFCFVPRFPGSRPCKSLFFDPTCIGRQTATTAEYSTIYRLFPRFSLLILRLLLQLWVLSYFPSLQNAEISLNGHLENLFSYLLY